MRLWRKASAVLKDNNSICLSKLARRTSFRQPELEAAIIKATSHDESSVDYKNSQRIFSWVHTSPTFLKPIIWALTTRMNKTRSWAVALKGLMLMHGILCCKNPAVRRIGRLPFDMSSFNDGHSKAPKSWGFNAFVRSYFAYLDQRSVFLSCDAPLDDIEEEGRDGSMVKVLVELQRLQALLDMLIQIRPCTDEMKVSLILEAMDCIIIEIFDVYSKLCNGIAGVLVGIFSAGKIEAGMALRVLQKAVFQGEDLSLYFEFCREIGVLNASEFPIVEQIPEEDIRDLERIINGVSERKHMDGLHDEKTIVVRENPSIEETDDSEKFLKTTVTENWVVFDDEFKANAGLVDLSDVENMNCTDPFAASLNFPPLVYDYNNNPANSNGFLQLEHYYNSFPGGSTIGNQGNWIYSL